MNVLLSLAKTAINVTISWIWQIYRIWPEDARVWSHWQNYRFISTII